MLMTSISRKLLMTKVSAGNAVKLADTNVYAILGSTKKGAVEFAKMAAVKGEQTDSSTPIRSVVNMPADNYFEGFMTYEEVGARFASTFDDFVVDRYNEIMDYLQFDKTTKLEDMSTVAVQKLKIAVILSRNSKVYMMDNPFNDLNYDARLQMLKVIFSWALTDNTIAIKCNNLDEVEQLIVYADEHATDYPVISSSVAKAIGNSFA